MAQAQRGQLGIARAAGSFQILITAPCGGAVPSPALSSSSQAL